MNRELIESKAKELRNILKVEEDNIDLNTALEELGIQLIVDKTIKHEGSIEINEKDNTVIMRIQPSKNEQRRRFTIAHELGHLILHQGLNQGTYVDSVFHRNLEYNQEEFEANEFAANLLMPKERFIKVLRDHRNDKTKTYDMNGVADDFNVSTQAAINRGRFLNVLER